MDFIDAIHVAKEKKKALFYNSEGSKLAYQLGIRHISALEFSGYAVQIPSGNLRIIHEFILVDFQNKTLIQMHKDDSITPIPLT